MLCHLKFLGQASIVSVALSCSVVNNQLWTRTGSQKVVGSNPISSTSPKAKKYYLPKSKKALAFNNRAITTSCIIVLSKRRDVAVISFPWHSGVEASSAAIPRRKCPQFDVGVFAYCPGFQVGQSFTVVTMLGLVESFLKYVTGKTRT